jgi:murein DD-endopeptidase MepM/ murein hydrolase activator NlpD
MPILIYEAMKKLKFILQYVWLWICRHIFYTAIIIMMLVVAANTLRICNRKKESVIIGDQLTMVISRLNKVDTISREILQILTFLAKNDSVMRVQLRHFPSTAPIDPVDMARISSIYEERIDPISKKIAFHWGIDYAVKKGTIVRSTAEGVVIEVGKNKGYGNYERIDHDNGYQTFFAHLETVLVAKGDNVKQNDIIGTVGTTGNSTGYHLHYEITYQYEHINPDIFNKLVSEHLAQKIEK